MFDQYIRNMFPATIANEIVEKYEDRYNAFFIADEAELLSIKGIGKKEAKKITNAFKFAHQIFNSTSSNEKVTNSQISSELIRSLYEPTMYSVEHGGALFLKRNNEILIKKIFTIGSRTATIFNKQDIFKTAVLINASALILFHNYPSGNLEASSADKKITDEFQKGAKLLDITILDHIILSLNDYFSFADNGLII